MMRRIIYSILCAIIISLFVTNVLAGFVRLSGVNFKLGSLIAEGYAAGLGNADVNVLLTGSGIPDVTCTNQGGSQAPGQNPPRVSAVGMNSLFGADSVRKNGKSPFLVETSNPEPFLNGSTGGCPNDNWTATIDFVYWTDATITIQSLDTEEVLLTQQYTCVTTRTNVSCSPVD
jgi:hypothetical protein